MRSTGMPRMRATVGFCAVACIRRPVRVRLRKSCSATTATNGDDEDDQALQRDRARRGSRHHWSAASEGKGCASAL